MNFLTWKILDSLQRWLHSPPVRQDPRFLGVAGCNNAVHTPFMQLPNFGLERWAFCLCAKLATRAVQDLSWYKSGCPWYQEKPCVWSFWLILISCSIQGCETFKIDMLKWLVALIGPSSALECRHCRQNYAAACTRQALIQKSQELKFLQYHKCFDIASSEA